MKEQTILRSIFAVIYMILAMTLVTAQSTVAVHENGSEIELNSDGTYSMTITTSTMKNATAQFVKMLKGKHTQIFKVRDVEYAKKHTGVYQYWNVSENRLIAEYAKLTDFRKAVKADIEAKILQ